MANKRGIRCLALLPNTFPTVISIWRLWKPSTNISLPSFLTHRLPASTAVLSRLSQTHMGDSYYPHLVLSLLALASFWVQSVVTEERLVPALHVLADHHALPDDVAGSTLMAAGASSPELLCTLASLFVTRSSLGLGTIVGSEIFNQLIVCAGSVYSSRGGKALVLDRGMVAREVAFYALSIGLLCLALSESRDDDGTEHIYVSFWKACLLFGGYLLYVLVCTNMALVGKCIGLLESVCSGSSGAGADSTDGVREHYRQHGDTVIADRSDGYRDDNAQSDSQPPITNEQSLGTSTSLGSIHYKVSTLSEAESSINWTNICEHCSLVCRHCRNPIPL